MKTLKNPDKNFTYESSKAVSITTPLNILSQVFYIMKNEIWLPIKDFENYLISNLGRVKSIKRNLILKQKKRSNGYLDVCFSKDRKWFYFRVHRFVYQAFKGELIKGLCIDHIDENKHNNNIDNLQQITYSQNIKKSKNPNRIFSQYEGVCFNHKKWAANISVNNKRIHIGRFNNEIDAYNARKDVLENPKNIDKYLKFSRKY